MNDSGDMKPKLLYKFLKTMKTFLLAVRGSFSWQLQVWGLFRSALAHDKHDKEYQKQKYLCKQKTTCLKTVLDKEALVLHYPALPLSHHTETARSI